MAIFVKERNRLYSEWRISLSPRSFVLRSTRCTRCIVFPFIKTAKVILHEGKSLSKSLDDKKDGRHAKDGYGSVYFRDNEKIGR